LKAPHATHAPLAQTPPPPLHGIPSLTQAPLPGSQHPLVQDEAAQQTPPGWPHGMHAPETQRSVGSQLLPFSTQVPSWQPHADEHGGFVLQHA
jgi:hypothetical protein